MIAFRNILCLVLASLVLLACASPEAPAVSQHPAQVNTQIDLPTTAPPGITQPALENTQPPAPTLQPATEQFPAMQTSGEDPGSATMIALVCNPGVSPTPSDMEGPYFLAGSPERASLIEPGMGGTPLTITGYVLTTDCLPVAGAKIEFWQADANGEYDLQGYRLRGHVFSDKAGRYQIETIIPAAYETRPPHIHVKVLPPGQPGLTTQLYFPGDSPLPELIVALSEGARGAMAVFNFILELK